MTSFCYLVPPTSTPNCQEIVGSPFVFKQKTDGRFMAQPVIQGYVQEPGIDSGKLYARVYRIRSIRAPLVTEI